MSLSDRKRRLVWHGILIVLLGMLTGAVIPFVINARMGLSAHLAGVQNGMLLVLIGLVWPEVRLSERIANTTFWLLLYSMYVIWIATLLGAMWGTSRSTPIAGAGHSGAAWQEALVSFGLVSGSVAILAAIVLTLYGLSSARTVGREP